MRSDQGKYSHMKVVVQEADKRIKEKDHKDKLFLLMLLMSFDV